MLDPHAPVCPSCGQPRLGLPLGERLARMEAMLDLLDSTLRLVLETCQALRTTLARTDHAGLGRGGSPPAGSARG